MENITFFGAVFISPTIKTNANAIVAPANNLKYAAIYPSLIIFPIVENGLVIDFPNSDTKAPISVCPVADATFHEYDMGTTITMAINSHSIAKIIKLLLFFLIVPSTL